MTLLLCVCIVLLLLSGFFSASETALMSLSRTDLRRLSQSDRMGRHVCGLLARPQRLLRTVLVGNMFVNVLFASFFAILLSNWLSSGENGVFERMFRWCFPGMALGTILRLGTVCRMLLNIVIVTPALMLCGEQTPKVVAYAKNVSVARLAALPLSFLCVVMAPVNWLLSMISNFLLRLIGQHTEDQLEKMTTDELISTFSVSEESGAASGPEIRILSRIVDFGGICVDEVMTPRVQVIGLDDRLTLRQAFCIARHKGHSWYPVYHHNLDGVWGMLSLVDYPVWNHRREMEQPMMELRNTLANSSGGQHAMYRPRFVPATVRAGMLLKSMRLEARNIAIVVDEHGGMEGMVTLNDIVAELLGSTLFLDKSSDGPPIVPARNGRANGR